MGYFFRGNEVRTALGLTAAGDFAAITSDSDLQLNMDTAYEGVVDDVELWVGGLAEDNVADFVLGETFFFLWRDQFTRLRDGDSDWYQNQNTATHSAPFSDSEIDLIEATTLADVISRNTGVTFDRSEIFVLAPPQVEEFVFQRDGNEVTIIWNSYSNAQYEIWASSDLTGVFDLIHEASGGDGRTSVSFTDNLVNGASKRFYRVVQK